MANIKDTLSSMEIKVLKAIENETNVNKLAERLGSEFIEVMRAIQWLQNKGLITITHKINEIIRLDTNGIKYLEKGFPEKKLLKTIIKKQPISIKEIKDATDELDDAEINVSFGLLKSKGLINIDKGLIKATDKAKEFLIKDTPEETLIKEIKESKDLSKLDKTKQKILNLLKKRKNFIKIEVKKDFFVELTEKAKQLVADGIDEDGIIEQLTPQVIRSGAWKKKKFKRYDIKAKVPRINGGKRHFMQQAIDYAKRIWLDLGFKEMEGNLVQTSFWVFDALFTAQDHPVREMQDTFFLADAEFGNLPDKDIVKAIKKSHEEGVGNSKGWQYSWSEDEAKRNVLRTHTTVLSAQTIYSLKKLKDREGNIKGKYFAIGRNFRNEAVDWSHLFEFNQTEGIVIDPKGNFRELLGYLKQFFSKMGFPDARFRPAFFSYTEPSVEIDVWHPVHKKWLEIGGAGMFRPEVTIPLLGEDTPVLAWGPGFDRIILDYYNINDIRDLYKNDLKQIAESRIWFK